MMKRFGIHIQLLVSAVLLITMTTFTLRYIAVKMIHQFVQSRFDERMHFLAKYLALNAELGILIDEKAMLHRLAENLLSEKDVMCVRIEDNNHRVLADVSKLQKGLECNNSVKDNRFSSSLVSVIETSVTLRDTSEEISSMNFSPIGDKKEQIIGKVRITYSLEGIHILLTTMKRQFLWLSVILAGVSVSIYYFISRSLVSQITQLVKATQKVAEGDLSLRVSPGSLPETRELSIAFNAMLDSLQESQHALDNAQKEMFRQKTLAEMGKFSMMIAHELKNPLSIIKTSLDILKNDETSKLLMIEYIDDEIKRLNRLIEDFLTFAKPVMPVFTQTDANALVNDVIIKFEMTITGYDIKIESVISESPCMVECDADLIKRTIENILKNAIEANEYKGVVQIRTTCNDSVWSIEISDQGPGISDSLKTKIFEPFFTTRSKGTGLGLAYVAQVVAAHKGKISVDQNIPTGAVFRVEIPKNIL